MSLNCYQFAANNPISFNDPTGALIDANPKGPLENLNPGFNAEPQWVRDSWNSYWSDPFGYSHGGNSFSGVSAIDGGLSFIGEAAQGVFAAFMNAFNNPDDGGNWSFTVGANSKGQLGFWESDYTNYSHEGNSVTVATHFVTWNEHFGKKVDENSDNNYGPGPYNWPKQTLYKNEVRVWSDEDGNIENVTVNYVNPDPPIQTGTDMYGREVTRALKVYGITRQWGLLSNTTAWVQISWFVQATYRWADGEYKAGYWSMAGPLSIVSSAVH